jgi:hypothetical protein
LLEKYAAPYSLEIFVKWFLKQSQKLLIKSGEPEFKSLYKVPKAKINIFGEQKVNGI